LARWHDHASGRAIADVREMIDVAKGYLNQALAQRLRVSPFSVALALDGQVQWRSAPLPTGADDMDIARATEALGVALVGRAQHLRAAAILVTAGDENDIPVGRMEGTHREAPPFVVIMPWHRDGAGRVAWLASDIIIGGWFGS
jgi:hypothetical protein